MSVFAALVRGDLGAIDEARARLLDRHGLGPYAWSTGARHPHLRHTVAVTIADARRMDAPLAEALRALSGISVIALKGLDYSHRLYTDRALRPMNDHDLLVLERDFSRALERLRAVGYKDALVQVGVARHPKHYATQLVRGEHHIDLHRSIRQAARAAVPYERVFERAERGVIAGASIAWLMPLDRLLLHCMHIAAHECMVPLVCYLDLELLLAAQPLDERVFAEARRWRALRQLQAVLFVRERLLGGRGTEPFFGARLLPSADDIHALCRPSRSLQLVRKALLLEGARERVLFSRYALGAIWLRKTAQGAS